MVDEIGVHGFYLIIFFLIHFYGWVFLQVFLQKRGDEFYKIIIPLFLKFLANLWALISGIHTQTQSIIPRLFAWGLNCHVWINPSDSAHVQFLNVDAFRQLVTTMIIAVKQAWLISLLRDWVVGWKNVRSCSQNIACYKVEVLDVFLHQLDLVLISIAWAFPRRQIFLLWNRLFIVRVQRQGVKVEVESVWSIGVQWWNGWLEQGVVIVLKTNFQTFKLGVSFQICIMFQVDHLLVLWTFFHIVIVIIVIRIPVLCLFNCRFSRQLKIVITVQWRFEEVFKWGCHDNLWRLFLLVLTHLPGISTYQVVIKLLFWLNYRLKPLKS